MNSQKPLSGLKVIDLSHRLPGPFCGKILSNLGAEVIKIEDNYFQDPFLKGLFSNADTSFLSWYENLNQSKIIKRFDFKNEQDQKKIKELIYDADIIIMGLSNKMRDLLKLNNPDLEMSKPFVVIELLASKKNTFSMHDLNALANSGLLKLYVESRNEKVLDPPFLPMAGISFGLKAANDLLAFYIKSLKSKQTCFVKTYLDEATEEVFGTFWPKKDREENRTKFLHNGLFPCYSLYQTADLKYVALACVEEKFWIRFCEIFSIDSNEDRFFNKNKSVFELLSSKISKYTQDEIYKLTEKEDICLSII